MALARGWPAAIREPQCNNPANQINLSTTLAFHNAR